MRFIARAGERQFTIGLPDDGRRKRITLDGKEFQVEWNPIGVALTLASEDGEAASHYGLIAGTRSYDLYVRSLPDNEREADLGTRTIEVSLDGQTYTITVRDERTQALASLASEAHISGEIAMRAPMPGLVSNVLAEEGAVVRRGQTIIVLEAMKMENDLTSPRAGVVKRLRVTRGQTVNQGDTLALIGDPAGASPAAEEDGDD
ncbi:MAG: biotin/lipoyl-binding protein [Ktedonobacterales bacterium]|nr:biotin/lipoyl-binding protein [Ktedonobacterales bacterium]